MVPISEQLRIYHISPSELTMKQIRENFNDWKDQDKLGGLIMFYDLDEDAVLIGPHASEVQVGFCVKALSARGYDSLDALNQYLGRFNTEDNRAVCEILMRVITVRNQKAKQERNNEVNPNSRFISIDGDIFQISKIISVKKRDEGGRYYIEFYITNKRASVKKEFKTQYLRDSEFQRVQKVLESAA